MEKTCGTCKFRGKEIRPGTGYFVCERVNEGCGDPYRKGQGAIAQDESNEYYAYLYVETDFGCTAWGDPKQSTKVVCVTPNV